MEKERDCQADLNVVCKEVYLCKYCDQYAQQPVLNVICGHLYCWSCVYREVYRSQQKGRHECCPSCNSHLDISPAKATIIRVCSGTKPGALDCPPGVVDKHMENAIKVEERHKVEGIPVRPWYDDASRHPSLSWFVYNLLIMLHSKNITIHRLLKISCRLREKVLQNIQKLIRNIIEGIEDGESWAKFHQHGVVMPLGETRNVAAEKSNAFIKNKKKRPLVKQPEENNGLRKKPLFCNFKEQHVDYNSFLCIICSKPAYEPVVSKNGHLFCWTCLNIKDQVPYVGCPITELSECITSGYASVSPIYFGINYEEEDALLIANRHIYKDKWNMETPNRVHPKLAFEFIDYMNSLVKKEGDEIIKVLDGVTCEQEGNEENTIVGEVGGRLNALFVWLVVKWSEKTKEQEFEKNFELTGLTRNIKKDYYFEKAWQKLGNVLNESGDKMGSEPNLNDSDGSEESDIQFDGDGIEAAN